MNHPTDLILNKARKAHNFQLSGMGVLGFFALLTVAMAVMGMGFMWMFVVVYVVIIYASYSLEPHKRAVSFDGETIIFFAADGEVMKKLKGGDIKAFRLLANKEYTAKNEKTLSWIKSPRRIYLHTLEGVYLVDEKFTDDFSAIWQFLTKNKIERKPTEPLRPLFYGLALFLIVSLPMLAVQDYFEYGEKIEIIKDEANLEKIEGLVDQVFIDSFYTRSSKEMQVAARFFKVEGYKQEWALESYSEDLLQSGFADRFKVGDRVTLYALPEALGVEYAEPWMFWTDKEVFVDKKYFVSMCEQEQAEEKDAVPTLFVFGCILAAISMFVHIQFVKGHNRGGDALEAHLQSGEFD